MLRSLRNTHTLIVGAKNIKFPDKLKGTILEKWALYWKNLFIDYRQMLIDLRNDIQDDPRKALKWSAVIATACGLATHNPTELDFKDELKKINNDIILVSEECRNPESMEHIRFLQSCYNEGVLHYRNFLFFSILYIKDVSESCDLYKAHCKYLKPTYFTVVHQIVDVGIMGRWWNFYMKTTDYDVKN